MVKIFVDDQVMAQILTSAIEAYEVSHKTPKGKPRDKLETFGLLWGYHTHSNTENSKITAVMATIETSATRHEDWVQPDFDSIIMKKEFIEKYWENLSLVGTFHSHPYDDRNEAIEAKGWRASPDGDAQFLPYLHEKIAPEKTKLAHLIVTMTQLKRVGTASTQRLKNEGESYKGYRITAGKRKLWFRAYGTERIEPAAHSDKKFIFTQ